MRRLAVVVVLVAAISPAARAQARPTGERRVYAEVGLGGARCGQCAQARVIGGPVLTGAVGLTLPYGFGVALLGRAFQELDFEDSQGSRYVVAVGQYTPPRVAPLTLSAGTGWGQHRGEPTVYANNDQGAVLVAGVALRVPARSRVALSVTADVMQSIGGVTALRPRLISGGLSLSIASARSSDARDR